MPCATERITASLDGCSILLRRFLAPASTVDAFAEQSKAQSSFLLLFLRIDYIQTGYTVYKRVPIVFERSKGVSRAVRKMSTM